MKLKISEEEKFFWIAILFLFLSSLLFLFYGWFIISNGVFKFKLFVSFSLFIVLFLVSLVDIYIINQLPPIKLGSLLARRNYETKS